MYPLKYAIKPIYKRTGRSDPLGYKEEAIYTYEPSKCYLVMVIKKYQPNDEIKVEYEVCFPEFDEETIEIRYSFYGDPCNTTVVNNIFDTYEEAKIEAKKMNEELKNSYYWKHYFEEGYL